MSDGKRESASERVLGGTVIGVLVRLLVMSFVVGLILTVLDVEPRDIVLWIERRVRAITDLSFDAFGDIADILILGAVVVIPVWLVLRVVRLLSR